MNHLPPGFWIAQHLPLWTERHRGQNQEPPDDGPEPPHWRTRLGQLLTGLGYTLAEWGEAIEAKSLPASDTKLARNCGSH